MAKVLVISVHPDDETLGCGGAILRHKALGDSVYCLFVTNGNVHQEKLIPLLQAAYGFDGIFCPGLPEIILDDLSLSKIIPEISKVFNEVQPSVVYLPNRSDTHSDHRRIFEAAQACVKSFRYPYIKKVLMCEIMSETDFAPALPENVFLPNVYINITPFMEQKMEIMRIFESELFQPPFTRSLDAITAHNRYRGSNINAMYAEAFMLLKEIIENEN